MIELECKMLSVLVQALPNAPQGLATFATIITIDMYNFNTCFRKHFQVFLDIIIYPSKINARTGIQITLVSNFQV